MHEQVTSELACPAGRAWKDAVVPKPYSQEFRDDVVRVAGQVADELRAALANVRGAEVLGAVECVISRMQDRHRWHALAKVPAEAGDGLGARVGAAVARVRVPTGVSIAIDVDPYDML